MLVKITDLDHLGRGITRIDNKITFVKGALPTEVVDIEITKRKKNFNEARIIDIKEASPFRIKAACPYYGLCTGCQLMHMSYESQLKYKCDKVKNILKRYANIESDLDIVPSNKEINYRNKITLHTKNGKTGYISNDDFEVKDIDKCLLVEEKINEYIKNKNTKEDLIVRTNGKDVISNLEEDYLIEEINDYKFRVDINSFFQVNNYICGKVFDYIEENIEDVNTCLDLYSGVGTLSIVTSKKANIVYSIEVNENSHNNALYNKELNKINNVEFMLGKVEDKIKEINGKIDLIITDPPRSGMDNFTIETILKIEPKKLIYMSCEPITLARDLNILKNKYDIKKIKLFDMFPNTYHCETVCVLERK